MSVGTAARIARPAAVTPRWLRHAGVVEPRHCSVTDMALFRRSRRWIARPESARPAGEADVVTIEPSCAVCGRPSCRIELIPPSDENDWTWQEAYEGPGGMSGSASPIAEEAATRLISAFSEPFRVSAIRSADLYDDGGFCLTCAKPYCPDHWSISATGFGTCPAGHGKSLDPHWHPPDDD